MILVKFLSDLRLKFSLLYSFVTSHQLLNLSQISKNDNELNEFANNLLKNKEEKQRIIDQIINKKVIEHLKNKTKIIKKSISLDDFTKLA